MSQLQNYPELGELISNGFTSALSFKWIYDSYLRVYFGAILEENTVF